ncbi:MAG: hypothetical protein C0618_06100 [Desulfuromonas sp.]|nr:MAG: hypothetical protein C0618_06100 [Desulfuromonas sp.]
MAKKKMEIIGERAAAVGYRRISKRNKIVARIDREDWLQHMAEHFELGLMELVAAMNEKTGFYEDYYRRNLSKDRQEVSLITSRTVPSSFEDPTGYVPKD